MKVCSDAIFQISEISRANISDPEKKCLPVQSHSVKWPVYEGINSQNFFTSARARTGSGGFIHKSATLQRISEEVGGDFQGKFSLNRTGSN